MMSINKVIFYKIINFFFIWSGQYCENHDDCYEICDDGYDDLFLCYYGLDFYHDSYLSKKLFLIFYFP